MDSDDIKRGLRAEIKKRENEQYATFQCNVRQMCKDVLAKLEEQEATIAEKDAQIASLNGEIAKMQGKMCEDVFEGIVPAEHIVCRPLQQVTKRIAELKKKLEDAKATAYAESVDAGMRERRLKRALWLSRAERYKMREFIAREEGNLRDQMAWSQYLRERTYNQWVDQLLRIANLANKLQNKCLEKAEEYN